DGTQKVSHTGTLSGMYSAVTLLPQKHVGFVVLINTDADEARTVLTELLVKHFTAPKESHSVDGYARAIAAETSPATKANPVRDTEPRRRVRADEQPSWLGVYRDPWFGEVSLCAKDNGIEFAAAKSPTMLGDVFSVGNRWLVDWRDEGADTEAWLDFKAAGHAPIALKMSKTDPDADFSSDYEDLAFARVRDCAKR
ncbi:MAG: penicillin-binding protein, partial [Luteimonas sp.]